uniref:Uncharacterized protein n=1 Tax=Setaria italica TaxID=4555 RepID=K3ZPF4_SETIT
MTMMGSADDIQKEFSRESVLFALFPGSKMTNFHDAC